MEDQDPRVADALSQIEQNFGGISEEDALTVAKDAALRGIPAESSYEAELERERKAQEAAGEGES
jgi:hypothetical protein